MTEDSADDAQPPDALVESDDPVPYDALHYTVQLPATPYSVAAARAISRAWCQSAGGERDGEALELLVSEAVTNAVRHGASGPRDLITIDITLTQEVIETSVSDHGPAFTAAASPPEVGLEQTSGFGLHIIAHLARTWVIERHATGNRITFTL
jgi:anti-sigma regulatory factor (Ser/Thr protein kinase)